MTKFINNVNEYLSEMEIKQTYLSMITGIDMKRMSCLLNGSQEENDFEMEAIARGLGKTVDYFLADAISIPKIDVFEDDKMTFNFGKPSKKQEQIIMNTLELIKNIDEIMSAEIRFDSMLCSLGSRWSV